MQRNQLGDEGRYRLWEWLKKQRQVIEGSNLSAADVAGMATKALEIPVSKGNIQGAGKILKIKFQSATNPNNPLANLAARQRAVEVVVRRLCKEFNLKTTELDELP